MPRPTATDAAVAAAKEAAADAQKAATNAVADAVSKLINARIEAFTAAILVLYSASDRKLTKFVDFIERNLTQLKKLSLNQYITEEDKISISFFFKHEKPYDQMKEAIIFNKLRPYPTSVMIRYYSLKNPVQLNDNSSDDTTSLLDFLAELDSSESESSELDSPVTSHESSPNTSLC